MWVLKNKNIKCELYNDHFENAKVYQIPKAQLIIADIPYNLWNNAYASNPAWYIDGDNSKWESKLANKTFFDTDKNFNIYNFFNFCARLLKDEPKEVWQAPCMIVFCSFEQQFMIIEEGKKHWFKNYINLIFRKNFSSQVLKANMRIVGNCEYAILLYREKLPKFNNEWHMIFNCFKRIIDNKTPKIHPTQKPVELLKQLIRIFTDKWDVVLDPCAWSGTTLKASMELERHSFWFEIKKEFYKKAKEKILINFQNELF
jgi:site-specific DNA-methyltransferase (adenine-specific)